jgi:hypothetical protein
MYPLQNTYKCYRFSPSQLASYLRLNPDPSLTYPDKTQRRLRYFNTEDLNSNVFTEQDTTYFVCVNKTSKLLLGIAKLQNSPYKGEESITWLNYVSVDLNHRKKGIATNLMSLAANYLIKHNRTLLPSSYTLHGELYLKPVLEKLRTIKPKFKCLPAKLGYEYCASDLSELKEIYQCP